MRRPEAVILSVSSVGFGCGAGRGWDLGNWKWRNGRKGGRLKILIMDGGSDYAADPFSRSVHFCFIDRAMRSADMAAPAFEQEVMGIELAIWANFRNDYATIFKSAGGGQILLIAAGEIPVPNGQELI